MVINKIKLVSVFLISLLSFYLALPSFLDSKTSSKYLLNKSINLGLDLRGGVSLLLEIELEEYTKEYLRNVFREIQLRTSNTLQVKKETQDSLTIAYDNNIQEKELFSIVNKTFDAEIKIDPKEKIIVLSVSNAMKKKLREDAFIRSKEIIRTRVDEDGTREIEVQREGENRLLLQIPGVKSPSKIKKLIGKTAKLSFNLVDETVSPYDFSFKSSQKQLLILPDSKNNKRLFAVEYDNTLSGDMLIDANVTTQNGEPIITFRFNDMGSKLFADITKRNQGRRLAIILDNKVISDPVINSPIMSGNGIIQGNFSISSANELALLLRSGALPAPIKIIEEKVVGASLGADSIKAGKRAILLGLVIVLTLMMILYRKFGIIANIALIVNLMITITLLILLDATLTLPGMAGIVLSLGMAVDTNVLIFERIKEEFANARSILSSLETGFRLAFSTILDSNITTITSALLLYIFGSGSIKSFSITLIIGTLSSMFTAITLTKCLIAVWYKYNNKTNLPL